MSVAAWNKGGYCLTSRSFISHDPYLEVADEEVEALDEDVGLEAVSRGS
jgi:hypothetical protein